MFGCFGVINDNSAGRRSLRRSRSFKVIDVGTAVDDKDDQLQCLSSIKCAVTALLLILSSTRNEERQPHLLGSYIACFFDELFSGALDRRELVGHLDETFFLVFDGGVGHLRRIELLDLEVFFKYVHLDRELRHTHTQRQQPLHDEIIVNIILFQAIVLFLIYVCPQHTYSTTRQTKAGGTNHTIRRKKTAQKQRLITRMKWPDVFNTLTV